MGISQVREDYINELNCLSLVLEACSMSSCTGKLCACMTRCMNMDEMTEFLRIILGNSCVAFCSTSMQKWRQVYLV